MVSLDVLRNVVGIVGNVISFGLFLAPVQTFWKINKKNDVEEFSADPYLAMVLNCILWFYYGLPAVHPNSILVVPINGVGFAIESIYLVTYFAYAPSKKRLKVFAVLGVEVVFIAALVLDVLFGVHTHERRSMIVGIPCVIAGSAMYASPLTVMHKVIKTKSVEYMPFYLSLLGLLNGACWTLYALIKFDLYITIPNGIGVFLSIIQLVLYLCYRKSTPKEEKNVELPTVHSNSKSNNTITMISIDVEQ